MANYVVNPTSESLWCDPAKQQIPEHGYISVSAALYAAVSSQIFSLTTSQPTAAALAPTHVTDGTLSDVGRQNRANGDLT